MSYHGQGYGQADWFYTGKSPADAPKYDEDTSGQILSPVPPAGVAAPVPQTVTAPAPPPIVYDDDDDDESNILVYAGIGIAALAVILIYIKFIRGGSEVEEIPEAPRPSKPKKPKTIKVEIAMDDDDIEEDEEV